MKEPHAETHSYERLGQLSLAQIKELREHSAKRRKRVRMPPLVPQERGSDLPLSYAQERLWFLDQLGLVGPAYNAPTVLTLEGELDLVALHRTFSEVIRRHESLRTRFESVAGSPIQVIDPPWSFALVVRDLSGLHEKDKAQELQRLSSEEAQRPFDLSRGPLLRASLVKLAQLEHVLLLTMHHIVTDGWSWNVLYREFSTLYGAYSQGRPSSLPELPVQYADYAIWQRQWLQGEVLQEQLQYWRQRLAGAPPQLELPTDRPRPAVESFKGAALNFELPSKLAGALKELGQREGATLFMVCLAAYQILLSRWSGQHDIVVGTPIAGRRNREIEDLIGFFINTLVLRTDVSEDLTFRQLLARVKEVTLGAYAHQDLPFEALVKELRPDRDLTRQPIFQVMLELENQERVEISKSTWSWTGIERMSTHFDLTLYLHEGSDGLSGTLEYATDLFDPSTIERMASHFRTLLEGIVANPDCPVPELPLLSEVEKQQLLLKWNATAAPYARERCVHDLFDEQTRCTPDAIAVVHEERSLTYAELNKKANQLARCLRKRGVGPEQLVGLCTERTLEMVIGLLGILKAGGAYLPLDPNYPLERLQHMLEDAAPQVVLTQHDLAGRLPATTAEVIELDEEQKETTGYLNASIPATDLGLTASNLVYVIYTSGSTGKPKGTAMPHRSMVNLIEWHRRNLRIREGQRVLQFAALSFDVAFQEVFSTLCTGGTLVLLDEWVRRDARALMELLSNQAIERLFVPPLMLQNLAEYFNATSAGPGSLKDVITAGEQLRISPETVDFFKYLHGCRLHNHYGPTETHVVTALTLAGNPEEWPALPTIGQPISNTQIYILDGQRQPVPIGVAGEIYIAGANVARGYLNRPELTAERFLRDPFSKDPQSRMYRTGDLGRWRVDGTIEYLGRNDNQVKIRGYRIELGDIEAHLTGHAYVREAAVIAREDVPGEKRLVAYVTQRNQSSLSVEELREHLKGMLPEYMVPTAFVILESLPLTPSGKLDRRSLPAPDSEAYVSQEYEVPEGEIEEAVAQIWQELLQVERVGRQDNFFELGGHSLLAIRALFKINESFGSALRVTDVYTSPTVRELASRISGGRTTVDEVVDLSREARLDDSIVAKPGLHCVPAKSVLLTGGTGFIGRFLLTQLLQDTDAIIYCLVRAPSQHQALSRIRVTLAKWDLWRDEFAPRIVAVSGDLRLPRLGVDEITYEVLSRNIDSIYHCGTSMNHLETYAMAKPANVESAKELLKLATNEKPKLINYISALGIFSSSSVGTSRVVDETSPIDHEKHSTSNGYAASKWVAEKIFMTAGERGIPCNIFRVGFVWADTQQGRYDELQRGYRILKSCLLSGYGIKDHRHHSPPTPVDYAARAVVFLANQHCEGRGIFHISSSSEMVEGVFERCNEIAGTSLKLLPFYEWICEIKRLHREGRSLPIVPLIEFAFSMDEKSFYEHQRRIQSATVPFDCTRTHQELEHVGIVAPVLNDDLLRVCVDSMFSRDTELREWLD